MLKDVSHHLGGEGGGGLSSVSVPFILFRVLLPWRSYIFVVVSSQAHVIWSDMAGDGDRPGNASDAMHVWPKAAAAVVEPVAVPGAAALADAVPKDVEVVPAVAVLRAVPPSVAVDGAGVAHAVVMRQEGRGSAAAALPDAGVAPAVVLPEAGGVKRHCRRNACSQTPKRIRLGAATVRGQLWGSPVRFVGAMAAGGGGGALVVAAPAPGNHVSTQAGFGRVPRPRRRVAVAVAAVSDTDSGTTYDFDDDSDSE